MGARPGSTWPICRSCWNFQGFIKPAGGSIVRHRGQHGPIMDAIELMQVLGPEIVTPALLAHVDFQPAEATAAEAPGA